jgi:D-sedoheptulose 7-phosphate isomerase
MSTEHDYVRAYLAESAAVMAAFAQDPVAEQVMFAMAGAIATAMRAGRKLMVAGNGGSAADAQHIAGEFLSRLMYDHAPLPAVALTTDSSALTAIGNDYGYEQVFDRQLRGLGNKGDVFLGISTSCRSPNILAALRSARAMGIVTLGFGGSQGGPMQELCDHLLLAPSAHTPKIQQVHITAAHIVCALVERAIFPPAAA